MEWLTPTDGGGKEKHKDEVKRKQVRGSRRECFTLFTKISACSI